MTKVQSFAEDLRQLVVERAETAQISRRTFLASLVAAGVMSVEEAHAAGSIHMINWGGDNAKWLEKAYMKPFEAESGISFTSDTSGPTAGKLRTIAESGKVSWDIADSVPHTSFLLGKVGHLDEIDYNIVDKSKVVPEFVYRWAVANGVFSNVLTYNSAKLSKAPTSWADVWNLKDFPGKRTFWKGFNGVLEAARMADGVPPAQVYPIDVDRALKKLKEIKSQTIFWGSGTESQALLREGEVTIGSIWSTRAQILGDDTQGRIKFTFNQGIMVPGVWIVPKN